MTSLSPWLVAGLLWLSTLGIRRSRGTWLAPSAFIGLVWAPYLSASLATMERPFSIYGTAALGTVVLALQLGAAIAEAPPARGEQLVLPLRLVAQASIVCMILALAGSLYLGWMSLSRLDAGLSLASLVRIGAYWTVQRYHGIFEPWEARLLIVWLHPAALLGGILFVASDAKKKSLAIATLGPALICSVLTGARAAFLYGLACWIGGYLAAIWLGNTKGLFTPRRMVAIGSVAALLLAMFVLIDVTRGRDPVEASERRIATYVAGAPAAFDYWMNYEPIEQHGLGGLSFAGVYDALGLRPRKIGTYDGAVNVALGQYINVFTAFRGLIEDFSFVGAVAICLLAGLAAGRAFSAVRSAGSLLSLSAFYAFSLFSPLFCLFSLNGPVLAWAVLWLVVIGPDLVSKYRSSWSVARSRALYRNSSPDRSSREKAYDLAPCEDTCHNRQL